LVDILHCAVVIRDKVCFKFISEVDKENLPPVMRHNTIHNVVELLFVYTLCGVGIFKVLIEAL
jgi:hypothetical protein